MPWILGQEMSANNAWKNAIVAVYERVDPQKVHAVDGLLRRYEGFELELMQTILDKYGVHGARDNASH